MLSDWAGPNLFIVCLLLVVTQIAKVGGEYMGILETVCGTSVIAVGSTVYELSGVSLASRTLEVLTMSTSECSEVADVPSSASCYRYVQRRCHKTALSPP